MNRKTYHGFCRCINWCRSIEFKDGEPVNLTNHHPKCEHYNDSLIDVWRISYNGSSCVVDSEPDPTDFDSGEVISKEKMHREIFENLPEFHGF